MKEPLATTHPDLAIEWHLQKNGDLTANQVPAGSGLKVWWRCSANPAHEWMAVISNRKNGTGCPVCAGKLALSITSLQALYPELAAEWHTEKNGSLTPDIVVPGSHKRIWWRCCKDPSHEWEARIAHRVKGSGCPACKGKVVTPLSSLRALYAELAQEWHPTKNGDLTPDMVRPGSNKKVWWLCLRDLAHEWQAPVTNRVAGNGCPMCSNRIVTATNSLDALYPELTGEWHPTKNGDLTPNKVVSGSEKKVWWRCRANPSHEWQARIAERVKGKGCPICANKIVTPLNSLKSLHPDLTREWHPTKNGDLTPDKVVPGSGKKVWWRCQVDPSHEWQAYIHRRVKGIGCPKCSGRVLTSSNSLKTLYPQLAQEWHPTKNGDLTAADVMPGSKLKVWWRCSVDSSHEWQAVIYSRVSGKGCRFCLGRSATPRTSLKAVDPNLAQEWHPTKNGDLTPVDVRPGSGLKVWWRCSIDPTHEWEAVIGNRFKGRGCPMCANRIVTPTNSLRALYPQLSQEWHPTKNGELTPDDVVPGSHRKVWWRCSANPTHEWLAPINERISGGSCPACLNRTVTTSNSLRALYPDLAQEWHPTKNNNLTPDHVVPGSAQKVWWHCSVNPFHEWQANINNRTRLGSGCPMCANRIVTPTNSLRALYPQLSQEWHPTKNGELTPDKVMPGSEKKVWWCCSVDPSHEWQATVYGRVSGSSCPACFNRVVTTSNSLRALYPQLSQEWHPTKNGELTPDDVVPGSHRKVWWRCSVNPTHEWQANISNRTKLERGCPKCNKGWTFSAIRGFVSSLREHLKVLTPAELYLLFQQNGLHTVSGKSKAFIKALATGRFPLEELDKFVAGEASLVDQFIDDPTQTLETLEVESGEPNGREELTERSNDVGGDENSVLDEALLKSLNSSTKDVEEDDEYILPVVETKAVLAALGHVTVSCADEEAVEFLISSALAKIWNHTFRDEPTAFAQAEQGNGDEYTERVRKQFLDEYRQAKELPIPQGYAFQVDGKPTLPNLMQRLVAVRVRNRRRVGNWSGTGAGKTLSAVLASRVVDARITIICCPNSVVEGWRQAIRESFPDSRVETKTFDPEWGAVVDETGFGLADNIDAHRYLVLNYEAFQQPESATRVRMLVEREQIDFVIVDEIHYAKQRQVEDISQRRKLVATLISLAAARNPDLYVMGMSATPVINNLQEGKSMVELVTGVTHNDLDTRPTVSNCMALHQRLVRLGIRWMPNYQMEYEQVTVQVDCSPFLDEIRALGQDGNPLALEQFLTRARLPIIRQHIKPKTLIYTYYVQGIDRLLRDALLGDGWKVGFYTGEDKSGLDGFLNGNLDVLIGSSAIGTGVDGLQQICNHLIINVLPWTAAEFEQLRGRLYRQGQRQQTVTMVLPLTYANVNGERWSWCESKVHRLHFKKSIADAAVDGVVPEGHLRTPAQAYQDLMAWLARIDKGELSVITRPKIVIPLPKTDAVDGKRRKRRYGTFSTMNRTWNQGRSDDTHKRLQENPEEWVQYHALYRETRSGWPVIPYEEIIRWCQERSGKVIGDFGCGEAKLAEAVSDRHTVFSFDHIAVNDDVVACDMTHVPLDDETLDVAIFSLSLMGINFTDYVREAHRTLKLDGLLHIIESTSRFSDRDRFVRNIEELGFAVIRVEDKWKFTHIHALKIERQPRGNVELRF